MKRVIDFLRRNWPLRLGAILLATVLYTGLVLGQNVREWRGEVPIERIRQPAAVTLISEIPPVTLIRYRAPIDVLLSPNLFAANVDLSGLAPVSGGPPVTVPVTLVSLDQRVQIVDFQPREVQVQLDPVAERTLPVTVELGTVPDGVTAGSPQAEPSVATLRGASSRVESVSQVVARVSIDAAALNVDRDVELVAVDGNGNPVPGVDIDPARARVRVAVARELGNRTLPVVPVLTGAPAAGYRIVAITVEPLIVTISGESATIAALEGAFTEAISVEGRTTDLEAVVNLDLPDGVVVNGTEQVTVTLTIDQDVGTRTFVMGFTLEGTKCACSYTYEKLGVAVTLGGPIAALQAVDEFTLAAQVDVTGLGPGIHIVPLTMTAPDGLQVVSVDPTDISIAIEATTPLPGPT
jgi:YbbR domain-containing protein